MRPGLPEHSLLNRLLYFSLSVTEKFHPSHPFFPFLPQTHCYIEAALFEGYRVPSDQQCRGASAYPVYSPVTTDT